MITPYVFGSSYWRTIEEGTEREWLLTNGIGGFAGHTITGGGNRMYHGYLIASLRPPVERKFVFTRTQEIITINGREYDLTSQNYVNWAKNGHNYLYKFVFDGLPTYYYQVEDVIIKKTIALRPEHNTVAVVYEVTGGTEEVSIRVVPLFNCKGPSKFMSKEGLNLNTTIEDSVLRLKSENLERDIVFYKSEGEYFDRTLIPTNLTTPNYIYEENHFYIKENQRGATGVDTHYTPYEIQLNVAPQEQKSFYFKCTVEELDTLTGEEIIDEARAYQNNLLSTIDVEDDFAKRLALSADQFISDRKSTGLKTILAGYPWFMDWGRDTMIALHGITLSTKRFDDARDILESFSKYVKNGLIPNNFPDTNTDPGYNTVDGSLWYFYAVDQFLKHTNDYDFIKNKIYPKLKEIIEAYKNGTDFDIKMDDDGLIIAGNGKCQLTWMDAMIGDWVVTPRHGKPVEINALWYNALKVMESLSKHFNEEDKYSSLAEQVKDTYRKKFWNEEDGCLYDVVDENDRSIRSNQIYAVFLPYTMLDKEQEKKIVNVVYKDLYTPYGLRSLSPRDEKFVSIYTGKHFDRDACYHMGTTWAYPIGAFFTAYCKVHDYSKDAVQKVKDMCLQFEDHLNDGCINGIAEIFDGMFPNRGKGCFTQAWSVSEILRVYMDDVLPNQIEN